MRDMYEGADPPKDSDGKAIELFDWEDFGAHRSMIFKDAKDALESQFPKEYNGKRMEISDLHYDDPESYDIHTQKTALHNEGFIGRRLRGTVKLTDVNTGEVLDEKKLTFMKLPYLTNRGTFIKDGNEWGSIAQTRLLPGAYARRQSNGDLEMQFNVRPGTGGTFRVNFNPESAQYKMNIGGSELHLYSLMKDIGVSDDDMRGMWGDEVFQVNADEYDSRVFEKAYNKIVPEWDRDKNPGRTREEKVQLIKNALDRSQMATKVAKKTLPTLFDAEKRASWSKAGETLEKLASMTRADIEDVAEFINVTAGMNIDLSASKAALIEQVRNAVTTGNPAGGTPDTGKPGVAAVRQHHMKRVLDHINSKIPLL